MVGKSVIKPWSLSLLRRSFSLLIFFFNFLNFSILILYLVDCSKCSFTKDPVLLLVFWYSVLAMSTNINVVIPWTFTGNDSIFLSMLLGILSSIRAGIKSFSTLWSNFCKCQQITGNVLTVQVTLCLKVELNAQQTDCGSVAAIFDNNSNWLIYSLIFVVMYRSWKFCASADPSKKSATFNCYLYFGSEKYRFTFFWSSGQLLTRSLLAQVNNQISDQSPLEHFIMFLDFINVWQLKSHLRKP